MLALTLPGPALGLLELESLARGVVVADALVKQATVEIVIAEPVSPGKYLLVFMGPEGEVAESFEAAIAAGKKVLLDSLHLAQIEPTVAGALLGSTLEAPPLEHAVGLVELHTVAATIRAADTALKRAQVRLCRFQIAKGIGGKGWFSVCGAQHDVEAALEAAAASVEPTLLVTTELIERPHPDLRGKVL